jgi:prepilin-type N-terminal cleavage/methylation domain-containing protein
MKKRNNEGFTLIEVALSIVVVAIGIMAVFSLMGSGLESNRKAISESQAAIFANDVFNSLRSASQQPDIMANVGAWESFWIGYKHQQPPAATAVSVAGGATWDGPTNYIYGYGDVYSVAFTNALLHGGAAFTGGAISNPVNGSLQYRLDICGPRFTNIVGAATQIVERVNVRLYVWDGLYAQADVNKALVFYSEYNNPGELK